MAESPSHKFGQLLGDILETVIIDELQNFCKKHSLYLDFKGNIRAARIGKKISWNDNFGNKHDLDFVIEKNGAADKIGEPVAFIESAWRRYTKHSRNKAQEIQGAILPLVEKYSAIAPFKGVLLAGEFTQGALNQLKSNGFSVLYFTYASVVKSFQIVNIDASFDENTADAVFSKKLQAWDKLDKKSQQKVIKKLIEDNRMQIDSFISDLENTVIRKIKTIRIIGLHGTSSEVSGVKNAIELLQKYEVDTKASHNFIKFEITVFYTNGNKIEGQFLDKPSVLKFLSNFN